MNLLALDPGFSASSGTGWALFSDRVLVRAGVITPRALGLAERCVEIRERLAELIRVNHLDRVVIEVPRVYPGPQQKGDQNDLIDLAVLCGALIPNMSPVELVHPRTWKGNVPKALQAKRILAALSDRERALFDLIQGSRRHNAIDAAGLGAWALK